MLAILMLPALLEAWRALGLSLSLPFAAHQHLNTRLDPAYEGRPFTLDGWLYGLPVARGALTEFQFRAETLDD